MAPTPGKLIVLSGPSGVGKGTLRSRMGQSVSNLVTSISATTRAMRPGEVEGVDYFFMTREAFDAQAQAGGFLEWAEYAGNGYGSPRAFVESRIAAGQNVLLEIEVQGALAIKAVYPQALLVFVAPPSLEELTRRLHGRNTDSEEAIAKRLATAQWELAQQGAFDVVLINDDLEQCAQALIQTLER